MQGYVATVQLFIVADSEVGACDAVSAALTDFATTEGRFLDWAYMQLGAQLLLPTEHTTSVDLETYEEGAFLRQRG